jgi:hypothetical protein
MSFDEVFGRPPEEPLPERPEVIRPSWWGPPEEELGVTVPLGVLVARSERGAVVLPHAVAHSNGIAFDVLARARGLRPAQANRLHHEQHLIEPGEEPTEGFLRLGVELADGTRLSNLGGWRVPPPQEEPAGPILMRHGGGGGSSGDGSVTLRPGLWLWPLPPPGRLGFSVEWPAVGIGFATAALDADELLAAAKRAGPLW